MTEQQFLANDWWPKPLPPNVAIGEASSLYSSFAFEHYHSKRPCGLRVGHDSGIYDSTFFNLGPEGEVQIGDYCTLVGPIISSNGRVVIGDYALISYEVVIADSFAAVPFTYVDALEDDSGPVTPQTSIVIGENVWIGARAVLLTGARIAEGAIIGTGTVVNFEVPAYAVVAGNPARVVSWARPKHGGAENSLGQRSLAKNA
jgi:acetyltransferase-like isoleucine patch superfamily enzyme